MLLFLFEEKVLYFHFKGGYLKVIRAKYEDSLEILECSLQLVFLDLSTLTFL
jgi:hypothetical protein